MDSLSAGILIYNGFVNLLQPLFSSTEYYQSSGFDKFSDAASVWFGCIVMAVIGLWA
jgi:zinc transporter 1/2/3